MFDREKIRDMLVEKSNNILDKRPLMVSDLGFFGPDVIEELDDMIASGDERAIEIKEKIEKLTNRLAIKKQELGL